MPKFHCHCKCSKCPSPAPTQAFSCFEKSFTAFSIGPCCRLQVAPDNLKRLLEFGDCLQLCFKLAVSLRHCSPYVIVHWVHIQRIWRPLVFGDKIWTIGPQPRRCALRVCWRAVLLEDESSGQPAIALKEG